MKGRRYEMLRPWGSGAHDGSEDPKMDRALLFRELSSIAQATKLLDESLMAEEAKVTPAIRTNKVSFKYATDDYALTNIGTTQATGVEVFGTGGATTLRPSFTTADDVESAFILLQSKFTVFNAGAAKILGIVMQWGTGASPSSWTRMQQYIQNFGAQIPAGDSRGFQPWYLFGSQEGPSSERLQPNTTYTFRIILTTVEGNGAFTLYDATELGKRIFCGVLHPY